MHRQVHARSIRRSAHTGHRPGRWPSGRALLLSPGTSFAASSCEGGRFTHSFAPAGRCCFKALAAKVPPSRIGEAAPAGCSVQLVPSQFRMWVHASSAGSDTVTTPALVICAAAASTSSCERLAGQCHTRKGGDSTGFHFVSSKIVPAATFAPAGPTTSAVERAMPSSPVIRS
jgi:hypothetical protein